MKAWIEAMRLRTLPVSIAGVIAGSGCAAAIGEFALLPALFCFLFALLAQIASNFANEYFDYKNGLDRKGREGFRRGVTEGDISPGEMKKATFATLALACIIGSMLLLYGGWWLIPVGVLIAIFALAYSAGPYPLSHHGLGDLAVIIFFGIVPVNLTTYLQVGDWSMMHLSLPVSISIGLMAANVLVVNNYRDADDDKAVGKRTTVVIFGRKVMGMAYLLSGIVAAIMPLPIIFKFSYASYGCLFAVAVYLILHIILWCKMVNNRGAKLNPILGLTACNLLLYTLLFTLSLLPGVFY